MTASRPSGVSGARPFLQGVPVPGAGEESEAPVRHILAVARRLTDAQLTVCRAHGLTGDDGAVLLIDGVADDALAQLDETRAIQTAVDAASDSGRAVRIARVPGTAGSTSAASAVESISSLIAVPIVVDDAPVGAMLAARTRPTSFHNAHEQTLVALAAVIADVCAAQRSARASRAELVRSARVLWASQAASVAVGSELDLSRVLSVVAKRGRALAGVSALVMLLCDHDELVVASTAGRCPLALGRRVPLNDRGLRDALFGGRTARIEGPFAREVAGQASRLIAIPLIDRQETLGALVAVEALPTGAGFAAVELEMLEAFAANAARVVSAARAAQLRLRGALVAADAAHRAAMWRRDEEHERTLNEVRRLLEEGISSRGSARVEAVRAAIRRIDEPRRPPGGGGGRGRRAGGARTWTGTPVAVGFPPSPGAAA